MALGDEKYIAFTTFRRSGEAVSTPTWVVPLSDGRIGFWTAMGSGKTKRLRHDPRVMVRPCDVRGRPRDGSVLAAGTAEMVRSGRLFDEVQAGIRAKYGRMTTVSRVLTVLAMRRRHLTYADTVVLVRLDA